MALGLCRFGAVNTAKDHRQSLFSTILNLNKNVMHYVILVIVLERFRSYAHLRRLFSIETNFFMKFKTFSILKTKQIYTRALNVSESILKITVKNYTFRTVIAMKMKFSKPILETLYKFIKKTIKKCPKRVRIFLTSRLFWQNQLNYGFWKLHISL